MNALPPGLPVVLDPGVRSGPDGVLVGGTPRRVLRLSPAGRRALAALQRGEDPGEGGRVLGRRLVDAGIAHPQPRPPGGHLDATLVVPVRDRPAQLARCLAAAGAEVPIIVVDDGSHDPAAVAAVAVRHRARLVRRETAGGPAAARNAALPYVHTRLVAFLDSDTVAPPGWLRGLAGHFADPQVGAVAPRVSPLVRDERPSCAATRSPLDLGPAPARVAPGGRVPFVPSAALVVRRRALGDGFDVALRHGEDVDLVWRLHDEGWSVRYEPAVAVAHDEPPSLRGLLARRWSYGTSAGPLARRHGDRLAPAVLPPPVAAALVLGLAGRPRPAAGVLAASAVRAAGRATAAGLSRGQAAAAVADSSGRTWAALARWAAGGGAPLWLLVAGRTRGPARAAVLAAPAVAHLPRERSVGAVAAALLDEAAYAGGVWWGALRTRQPAALLPRLGAPAPRGAAAPTRRDSGRRGR